MLLSRREQRLYEIRFVWIQKGCRREEGHNSYPLECLLSAGRLFSAKTTKILSTRNSSILMMSSSEYLLLESECSFTKYVSSCPNTKYLYLRLPFLKSHFDYTVLIHIRVHYWLYMLFHLKIKMCNTTCMWAHKTKRKRSDSVLWQKPYTKEMSKGQSDNTNNATENSITQRLGTNWGRSVAVTTATQTGVVNRFTGLTFPTPRYSRVIERTYLKNFIKKLI